MKVSLGIIVLVLFYHTISYTQEITMFPGFWSPKYYQNSDQITSKEVGLLMQEVDFAHQLWRKSNTQNTVAWVALGAQLGFSVYTLSHLDSRRKSLNGLVGSLVCSAISIGYSFASQNTKRKAILSYNKFIKEKHSQSLYQITPSKEGLGIALHF